MTESKAKQLHLGVLLYGCGHHQAAWLMPDSSVEHLGEISYYQSLAQLAEKGYFDAVFFADNQSFPAQSSSDMPAFWFDLIVNLTENSLLTNNFSYITTI